MLHDDIPDKEIMSRLVHLIIYIILLSTGTLYAQNINSQLLEQAEQDYQIGRFDQALGALDGKLGMFQGTELQKALRLTALCHLAKDDLENAEYYARQLVTLNNYYTSVDDPIRFEEMINRIKLGLFQRVTTASNVAESINEAPSPVTIITAEMIENLGYSKRLGQILAAYVPGMAEVSSDGSDNMSMHGAFSTEQELILVMENGHRLNNRAYNSIPMDYAISTEKIDHIEVLRGPASSLYGNVALSAVVNIITKTGGEQNGIKMKYGYGSYGTHKADLTMGTRFMDADIFVWGSFYRSSGQARSARDSAEYYNYFLVQPTSRHHAYVDAYKDPPCYDVGMTFKLKGFDLMLSRKNSKKLYQYGRIYGYYDYDKYRIIEGMKPGDGIVENHAELSYAHQFGQVSLTASAYGDWYGERDYTAEGAEFDDETKYETSPQYWHCYSTKERTLGGNLRAATNYRIGNMKGNFLIGAQYEHFSLTDYYEIWSEDINGTIEESSLDRSKLLQNENSLSFYAQAKNHLTSQLILNAGVRYDIKYRAIQNNAKAVSPRLALIYTPKETFSIKLTYSQSFVDMSYSNRVIRNYFHDTEYLPQYLRAMQLNIIGRIPKLHFNYDVNLFYNHFKNLYYLNFQYTGIKKWENEGAYKCLGMEASGTYTHKSLTAIANIYWCKVLSANNYYYSSSKNRVAAVPHMTANLNLGWKCIEKGKHQLKVYANANFCGSKVLKTFVIHDISINEVENRLNSNVLFDAGVKYTYNKHLQIAAECENLLNTDRFLLGSAYDMYPYFQRGRTLMASVAYSF